MSERLQNWLMCLVLIAVAAALVHYGTQSVAYEIGNTLANKISEARLRQLCLRAAAIRSGFRR